MELIKAPQLDEHVRREGNSRLNSSARIRTLGKCETTWGSVRKNEPNCWSKFLVRLVQFTSRSRRSRCERFELTARDTASFMSNLMPVTVLGNPANQRSNFNVIPSFEERKEMTAGCNHKGSEYSCMPKVR